MTEKSGRFLYMHIPKTGGVAFRQILENSVNHREIAHFRAPSRLAELSDADLSAYRLVHGHFNFRQIRHLKGFMKLVTLREPVSRCLSTYSFWKGLDASDPVWPEKSRLAIERAQSLSILEMMNHPDPHTAQHFDNIQTRVLSGVVNPADKVTEAHLELAIRNLLSFDFVATTENLEYCKALLCKKFGLYYPETPVRLNASKVKEIPDPTLSSLILERNMLDVQLLNFVNDSGLDSINGL